MLEAVIFGLFIAGLLTCVALDLSVIWAFLFGLAVFFAYGLIRAHTFISLLKMSWQGIATTMNILIIFTLIGALTASWRASGTIPFIVFHAAKLISPHAFLLAAFLLCCAISALMGTAFGTSATIGVICMTMGRTMGISEIWLGGAVLAGAFFGDRCSPMSTSALLVSTLTKTDIYRNIVNMIKSAVVPFVLSCAIYIAAGLMRNAAAAPAASTGIFAQHFDLSWVCVLPAAAIVIMSAFRLSVKITVPLSIVIAAVICVTVQDMSIAEMLKTLVLGYTAEDVRLSSMLSGGGIVSMLLPVAIVCISSCYSGIFDGTSMLDSVKSAVKKLADRITPVGSAVVTSVFSAIISCNQTLAIMLTDQLCKDSLPDDEERALALENTAVVISPLVPWSIAGAVPLAAIGAPTSSLLFACYLYLVPLCSWAYSAIQRQRKRIRISYR